MINRWQQLYNQSSRAYIYGLSPGYQFGAMNRLPTYTDFPPVTCRRTETNGSQTNILFTCINIFSFIITLLIVSFWKLIFISTQTKENKGLLTHFCHVSYYSKIVRSIEKGSACSICQRLSQKKILDFYSILFKSTSSGWILAYSKTITWHLHCNASADNVFHRLGILSKHTASE